MRTATVTCNVHVTGCNNVTESIGPISRSITPPLSDAVSSTSCYNCLLLPARYRQTTCRTSRRHAATSRLLILRRKLYCAFLVKLTVRGSVPMRTVLLQLAYKRWYQGWACKAIRSAHEIAHQSDEKSVYRFRSATCAVNQIRNSE